MSIKIGSLTIADTYFGSSPISAIYQGSNLIWQRGPVTDEPFYVTSDEAFTIQLTQTGTVNAEPQMSSDKSSWMSLPPGVIYDFQAGQKIYIRNVASTDWSLDASNDLRFGTGCTFKTVGGNAKSLINNSDTLPQHCFRNMFNGNTSLVDVSSIKLPWLSASYNCYRSMFFNCTALKYIPIDLLPATTLAKACYRTMFSGCSSLETMCRLPFTGEVPGASDAGAYLAMFQNCTALTKLPKLNMSNNNKYACVNMFRNCTNIKISSSQTAEYTNEYYIPEALYGASSIYASYADMFSGTGGTFSETPEKNTTYYTSNEVIS